MKKDDFIFIKFNNSYVNALCFVYPEAQQIILDNSILSEKLKSLFDELFKIKICGFYSYAKDSLLAINVPENIDFEKEGSDEKLTEASKNIRDLLYEYFPDEIKYLESERNNLW